MIRPGVVWSLAGAESRLTRRLARYWVFQVIALILGVGITVYYGLLHQFFSSWSGTAALLNPRYLAAFLGMYYLVGFLFGLVFLGFDIRARDKRERIMEVVDSLPCTNLELMLGRFIGIMLPSWIPVLIICGILYLVALLMGGGLEPLSLISFATFLAIPAYVFVLGLTFLLTMVLRHRLLIALVAMAFIIGMIVINFGFVPIYLLPAVDLTGGFSAPNISDLTPTLFDIRAISQRAGFLFVGLAMLWFAAALHPRRDDSSRGTTAALGGALLLIGAALLAGQVWQGKSVIDNKAAWRAAHAARADESVPDLVSMRGAIQLTPGSSLGFDLELTVAAPADDSLQQALFSLNPGMRVSAVTDAGGSALTYTQEDGLLDIQLSRPLQPGEQTSLQLQAEGVPDAWFAYLESAFEPFALNIKEGNIFILGFMSLIFDSDYTVLLPGIRWLPAAGPEVGRGDPSRRPRDFFEIDLTVEVPDTLLVAGPGRRQDVDGAAPGARRFRFAPPAPVPGVALVAGELESRSTEIDGVTLEVLVHEKHVGSLEFFEDAEQELHDWLAERLGEAAQVGLPYPYDALTLVEVPGYLRGYAGGWRMDTTFTQPAMVFMRESGFPTARFDTPFKGEKAKAYEDKEGGLPRGKREILERFFENDLSGGNPFVAAARSFFSNQTTGSGSVGVAMDYLCEDLSTRLVTDKTGYFSVHHYGADMNTTIQQTIGTMFSDQGTSVADAMIQTVSSRTDVWDEVLKVSLADLDPWEAPKRALDVLTLKGGAMSRSMLDDLGRAKTGEVLAALHARSSGGAFAREDVIAAGEEVGVDLAPWLDIWLDQTDLPGFVAADVLSERITDSDDGAPRYQNQLTVRNGEATPGLLRVEYRLSDTEREREKTDPVRVEGDSAIEIGIVTSKPVRSLRVVPYLALNRDPFNVNVPAVDDETLIEHEPFSGTRPSDWSPVVDGSIVVDDLDPGFSVVDAEGGTGLRVGGKGLKDVDTDQGLPVATFGQASSKWSRRTLPSAFGKYRHTTAQIRAGSGERRARFSAELPRAGRWKLEYHVPKGSGPRGNRRKPGSWSLTISDGSDSQDVTFDATDAEQGWNSLGTFEMASGEAHVDVSDKVEDGRFVMADAIRWSVDGSKGSKEASNP